MNNRLELPAEIKSLRGEDLFPLMDALERKHEPIKKYFCTGIGIKLHYLDSQIAEKVMLKFSKSGYAILPLHDSFIIHYGCEKALNETMKKAFFDMFDVECKVDLKYDSWGVTAEDSRKYNIEPTVFYFISHLRYLLSFLSFVFSHCFI